MIKIVNIYNENNIDFIEFDISITKPGIDRNINGVMFDNDSYIKIMNSDYIKKLILNKAFPLLMGKIDMKKLYNNIIPLENTVGYITNWTMENITVNMYRRIYDIYIRGLGENNLKAGILGTGEFKKPEKDRIFQLYHIFGFNLLFNDVAL